ncbi:MAG TPA: DUF1569 domain-containing protein [Bacteroidia bacterium]|nr:DUF1569 domain-containing protein [Bacteroidia bacterium]
MKSIFDRETRDEVINRIQSLNANSKPHWGKMTVAQMIKHCALCEEYYYGNIPVNRSFLGRIIGKMAIKSILKDENASLRKNAPTPLPFKVTENVNNLEVEKNKWVALIERYGTFNKDHFTHWFFGKMSRVQLGQFIYKHSDHHLRQFGV